MGRPSIITDSLIEAFCHHVRISGSIPSAITATGIGRESFYRWARRVRQGIGSKAEERFIKAVTIAEGEVKMRAEVMLAKFFATHWRFFETADKNFPHMTPIQGDWTISGIHLPTEVLEKVYFGNAKKLLARALARLPHGESPAPSASF